MSEPVHGIEVPYDKLSQEALSGLIEEFVLREGTDYGLKEFSLDEKKAHVLSQLKSKKVRVVFDPVTESTSIMTADQFHKFLHN